MKNFESCYLVGLDLTAFKFPEDFSTKNFPEGQCLEVEKWKPEESLSELRRLANTAGIKVLGLDWQRREKPDQKTYVGLGKLLSISKTAIQLNAQILLFDDELTPAQIRAIGEEKSRVIQAEAEKNKTVILAEAKRDSEILRGEGEAEKNRILGEAFSKDPEFFSFYRSIWKIISCLYSCLPS